MKSIGIVTDSCCGLSNEEAARLDVKILPMTFSFGDDSYYEGVSITREEFFDRLKSGEDVFTSQPSPEAVMNIWREVLKEYDSIIHMPLSSGLSGSCNTARILAMEEEFEGKVFVVDNGRISTLMHRAILDAVELIEEGYSAQEIQEILEEYGDKMSIFIAVEGLDLLKKGGRISGATATVGTVLNIKPILKLGVGVLENFKISRGMKKARADMIEAMKEELNTTFKEYYDKGEVYILAASSADENKTRLWLEEIRSNFPDVEILCDDLSLAICCHIGEGGLGIGCSCRPRR